MNYRGKEVTVEDMVAQVQFLQRLKIPFLLAIFIIFCSDILLMIGSVLLKLPLLHAILVAVVVVYYIGLIIGFFIYRRKLVAIMPFELTKKVKKLTFRVTALATYILVTIVIVSPLWVLFPPTTAAGALVAHIIFQIQIAVLCFFMMSVCLSWKKKFPWVSFNANQKSSSQYATPRETIYRT
eukprot:CAMPEP_0168564506 /NCGR_PEP_ID=MMETSP0413-20121227/13288_1 /TAXON_ID=136452 /ORGANISM="Filamoeba nolandi, Strain NC-AS-23-1" /LENGTH=181 /DNA_ID=CAMNT_0008596195 /DNA_START=482 /DNA_END=1023 /DNA_ORIENTATION=-